MKKRILKKHRKKFIGKEIYEVKKVWREIHISRKSDEKKRQRKKRQGKEFLQRNRKKIERRGREKDKYVVKNTRVITSVRYRDKTIQKRVKDKASEKSDRDNELKRETEMARREGVEERSERQRQPRM